MSDISLITYLSDKKRFGTQTRLAQAAGVKPHTICGKKTSTNPLTHQQMIRILRNAPEMGVEITPADFFPDEIMHEASDAA